MSYHIYIYHRLLLAMTMLFRPGQSRRDTNSPGAIYCPGIRRAQARRLGLCVSHAPHREPPEDLLFEIMSR